MLQVLTAPDTALTLWAHTPRGESPHAVLGARAADVTVDVRLDAQTCVDLAACLLEVACREKQQVVDARAKPGWLIGVRGAAAMLARHDCADILAVELSVSDPSCGHSECADEHGHIDECRWGDEQ